MTDIRTLDNLYRRLDEATNLVIAARADVRAAGSSDALDSIRDYLTDCFSELAGIIRSEQEENVAESERLSCYTKQRRAG